MNDEQKYIIVGSPLGRAELAKELKVLFGGDPLVVAPTMRKIVRPRRKSSSRKPIFRYIPLFYEYAAVEVNSIGPRWEEIFRANCIWYVLLDGDKPKFVEPDKLLGMLSSDREFSWEGKKVIFNSGPFKGYSGEYRSGKVWVNVLGNVTPVKVDSLNLSLHKN